MMQKSYQLLQGDCLQVMKTLADDSVDLCLTDPPYGTTACKWDSVVPFESMWKELKRICKPKAAICLFGSQPFTSALVMSNPKNFKYEWIWDKKRPSNPMLAKVQALKVHESICVFQGGNYYPQDLIKTDKPRGGVNPSKTEMGFGRNIKIQYKQEFYNYPKSIIQVGTNNGANVHPTQKPVELLRYLIRTYTKENETVLDFTMGSGSTGVACQLESRKFIGIEKDANYFAIAEKRIESALNAHPLFAEVSA